MGGDANKYDTDDKGYIGGNGSPVGGILKDGDGR